MPRPKGLAGFTLVELMIVLTVLAIFATLAVPSFNSTIERNRLQTQADELKSLLFYARGEAVSRKATITAAADSSDLWSVKRSDNEALRELKSNSALAQIRASTDQLKFRSNGTATPATFTVCHDDDPATGLYLEVLASGAIKLYPQGKKDANETPLDSCTL